jgi:DNA-binding CsgD family transcriptional regulator
MEPRLRTGAGAVLVPKADFLAAPARRGKLGSRSECVRRRGTGPSRSPAAALALEAAATATSVIGLAGDFLPLAERAIDASAALLFTYGDDGRPCGLAGGLTPHLAAYNEALFGCDPVQAALRRVDPRRATVPLDDVLSWSAFRRTVAYHEFYRPLGAVRLLGMWPTDAPYGSPGMTGVVFARPVGTPPFGREQSAIVERWLPPVRALIERERQRRLLERRQRWIELLVGCLDARPALILDRRGRTLWASPAAEAHLREHAADGPALARAASAVSRATCLILPGGRGAELRTTTRGDEETVVLAQLDAAAPDPERLAAVGRRAGLSEAETRVLERIARGLHNHAIARELFVSLSTVKTHVRQILAKLEVDSRTQAALVAHAVQPPVGGAKC